MVLVDANVLIDVFTDDPVWREWSESQLIEAASMEELAINPIIYAEVATAYRTQEALERALGRLGIQRLPLPYEAGFVAARAFLDYRKRGGTRRSPLPDFYIGAHAQCEGHRLLTRDDSRYRTYFPQLALIAPE